MSYSIKVSIQESKSSQRDPVPYRIFHIISSDEGNLLTGNLLAIFALSTCFDDILSVDGIIGTTGTICHPILVGQLIAHEGAQMKIHNICSTHKTNLIKNRSTHKTNLKKSKKVCKLPSQPSPARKQLAHKA